ncbi:MAG: zf-TFIIB domain-containing protein [Calditrichia bacterium]|jgi:hypothetical protein
MDCPVCKTPMMILEYNQVELDYCPTCEGTWLDQGELELIIDLKGKTLDLSDLPDAVKSDRRCPRCRKKMKEAKFPHTDVEVDICPRDGGIWLDKGELLEIADSQANSDSHRKVQNFIKELFGEKADQKEA